MDKEYIQNIPFYNGNIDNAINKLCEIVLGKKSVPKYCVFVNPHSIQVSKKDKQFFNAISRSDFILPDGYGIVLASKILNGKIKNRITGFDIFSKLCNSLAKYNQRVNFFLLGSTVDVLKQFEKRLNIEYPFINVCGSYSPPFVEQFDTSEIYNMVDMVNNGNTDVLLVGMTAPKQEKLAYSMIATNNLNTKLILPIGAVFDFYSGKKKRAGKFFQEHGLEWLIRLLYEPRRMWRRNFISMPIFIFSIITEKIRRLISYS